MESAKSRQVASFMRVAGPTLKKIGIDTDKTQIFPQFGRNLSAVLRSENKRPIFVKIIIGLEAAERFNRSVSFFKFNELSSRVNTPRLLDSDCDHFAVVYEVIDDSCKISELVSAGTATMQTWEAIGKALGQLHSWSTPDTTTLDSTRPTLPPSEDWVFSLDFYESASSGQIELLSILQSDLELRGAIELLLAKSYTAVPIHGDLRTDQLFEKDEDIWFIDWEDFRLGDPARDLGSLMGEVFFHHMKPLFKRVAERGEINDDSIRSVGIDLINEARPAIVAIWNGYREQIARNSKDLSNLADSTIGFLGWQMFDRVLSIGGFLGRISGFEKAIIGIGRQMLIHRGSYSNVLGLDSEE